MYKYVCERYPLEKTTQQYPVLNLNHPYIRLDQYIEVKKKMKISTTN